MPLLSPEVSVALWAEVCSCELGLRRWLTIFLTPWCSVSTFPLLPSLAVLVSVHFLPHAEGFLWNIVHTPLFFHQNKSDSSWKAQLRSHLFCEVFLNYFFTWKNYSFCSSLRRLFMPLNSLLIMCSLGWAGGGLRGEVLCPSQLSLLSTQPRALPSWNAEYICLVPTLRRMNNRFSIRENLVENQIFFSTLCFVLK